MVLFIQLLITHHFLLSSKSYNVVNSFMNTFNFRALCFTYHHNYNAYIFISPINGSIYKKKQT